MDLHQLCDITSLFHVFDIRFHRNVPQEHWWGIVRRKRQIVLRIKTLCYLLHCFLHLLLVPFPIFWIEIALQWSIRIYLGPLEFHRLLVSCHQFHVHIYGKHLYCHWISRLRTSKDEKHWKHCCFLVMVQDVLLDALVEDYCTLCSLDLSYL